MINEIWKAIPSTSYHETVLRNNKANHQKSNKVRQFGVKISSRLSPDSNTVTGQKEIQKRGIPVQVPRKRTELGSSCNGSIKSISRTKLTKNCNMSCQWGYLVEIVSLIALFSLSTASISSTDVSTEDMARLDHHFYVHHHKRRQQSHHQCTTENEICSTNNAHVCRNNTCVSACSLKSMRECVCDSEEENYCYLCCGNADNKCLPAHEHDILRNNGERWERESCARCRMNGAEMEGSACDDRDPQRLCLQGKCSKSVCHAKQEGAYCDRKLEKVCVDDICDNPCSRIASHLMVCDCPAIDPDTGFASEDRCQLCCYDFTVKPASRRCQSAFRKYRIANAQNRPIWRVGLDCAGGKRCNRYGICTNNATPRASLTSSPMVPLALFLFFLVVIAVLAAVFTTSESF